MAPNEIGEEAMAQVHNGLGILYGIERISKDTHDQIIALLKGDQGDTTAADKNAPTGLARMAMDDKSHMPTEDSLLQPGADLPSTSVENKSRRNPTRMASLGSPEASAVNTRDELKIVCPWWLAFGTCRLRKCRLLHKHVPGGIEDPLICHFWADGGRCTKDEATCQFAHYQAAHGIVAHVPVSKAKMDRDAPLPIRGQKAARPEWFDPDEHEAGDDKDW
ncbi:hypothetical protein GGS26DRAFT_562398 [Hypomontagnella submonticulosa]|nr:hypothetical protein GGS26DRAFT_562398 [Hypomontagnella submonticulosa]